MYFHAIPAIIQLIVQVFLNIEHKALQYRLIISTLDYDHLKKTQKRQIAH